jgi:hypothetical protein
MRSRRSLATALSLALAFCEIGTPVALGGSHAKAVVPPGARATDSPRAGATVVRVSERDAFDWADAGIGVAGGVALSILGTGLVLLVSDRRRQASSRSSTRPST